MHLTLDFSSVLKTPRCEDNEWAIKVKSSHVGTGVCFWKISVVFVLLHYFCIEPVQCNSLRKFKSPE
jgi:hypothetical protein